MSSLRRLRAMLLALVLLAPTGCTVGPSSRPALATQGQRPAVTGSTAPSTPPTGPGGPGRQADPLDWGSCPSDVPAKSRSGKAFVVECANLEVPLTYAKPSSSTLTLTVARARTADTPEDATGLVAIFGDPGVNGVGRLADITAELPAALLADHAIVTLDLRGSTAVSRRMACFRSDTVIDLLGPPIDPTKDDDAAAVGKLAQQAAFDCADQVGSSITEFSSTAAADDLDSLRSALGVEKLQFIGRGFGATLGADYAHRYPARVEKMVLDSPSDPQPTAADTATARAIALEASMDEFAADCTARPGGCPLGADPRGAVSRLIADLGDIGDSDGRYLITGGSVLLLLSQLLGRPDQWPTLTSALAAARSESADVSKLSAVLAGLTGEQEDEHLLETALAYTCNDTAQRLIGASLIDAATAAKAKAPMFGAFMIGQAGLCSAWPAATTPIGRLSAVGAAPILVAGAVQDPIAPYSGIKSLAAALDSATLISWQSGSHQTFPNSSCVSTAVLSYLKDGTSPANQLCPP